VVCDKFALEMTREVIPCAKARYSLKPTRNKINIVQELSCMDIARPKTNMETAGAGILKYLCELLGFFDDIKYSNVTGEPASRRVKSTMNSL
jgi:hypothetical protein